MSNVFPPKEPTPYHASAFNEFGDEELHWSYPSTPIKPVVPITTPLDTVFAHYFVNKIHKIEEKTTVVLIPAVFTELGYKGLEYNINGIADFLSKNGCAYAVPTKEFMLNDSCAYDGTAHMNKSGVDINTRKIIEILRPIVKAKM
jgi:hypothetical protein